MDNSWNVRKPAIHRILLGGVSRTGHRSRRRGGYPLNSRFAARPRFLVILSNLGVIASQLEGAQGPCSREEILLGFMQEGGPEQIKVS